jgi:hypothetical protein
MHLNIAIFALSVKRSTSTHTGTFMESLRIQGWRRSQRRRLLQLLLLIPLFILSATSLRAAIQFDVYLGMDEFVPEASWFPIVCEVHNDGPAFNGTIEVSGTMSQGGYPRRVPVELPTGTRKRVTIPVFCDNAYNGEWQAVLRDANGKVREDRPNLRAKRVVNRDATLVGSLPRQLGWSLPLKAPTSSQQDNRRPVSARLLPPLFPDNPIVLEGMNALYLSSERATDLREQQVQALLSWVRTGGHLIVAVDQISDISGNRWLRELLPVQLNGVQQVKPGNTFEQWLRSPVKDSVLFHRGQSGGNADRNRDSRVTLATPYGDTADDANFGNADLSVVTASPREGKVELALGELPLIVSSSISMGKVTVLLFSPEREPLKSWKNAPAFWSRLTEVSPQTYVNESNYYPGGWGLDGVFGGMIDSRQVRKLPIPWLLLLLLVYLAIIGPVDQFWLKKIGKPMLTWITFPCYVALFSGLIYLVGYKLRAGESEWNELHVVDVFNRGEMAELRGRTFGSVYSPANQRYTFEAEAQATAFRGEYVGSWNTSGANDRGEIIQGEKAFRADVFVPVWTCQLYVNDWLKTAEAPFFATVERSGNGWKATVQNKLDRPLTHLRLVVNEIVYELGEVPARQKKEFISGGRSSSSLNSFVGQYQNRLQTVVQERRSAFGASEGGRLTDLPGCSSAVSFLSHLNGNQNHNNLVGAASFDLSGAAERGNAILLAWVPGPGPIKPLNKFSPRRTQINTLWRMTLPTTSTP